MNTDKATIKRLETGVPGLDEVLGGGLPEFSFNIIAGPPGCGKTTLAHQIMFALAHAASGRRCTSPCWASRRSRCCATSSSSTFFDSAKIDGCDPLRQPQPTTSSTGTSTRCWRASSRRSRRHSPGMVVRRLVPLGGAGPGQRQGDRSALQEFVQQLGMHDDQLAGHHVPDRRILRPRTTRNPVFTVADGLSGSTRASSATRSCARCRS